MKMGIIYGRNESKLFNKNLGENKFVEESFFFQYKKANTKKVYFVLNKEIIKIMYINLEISLKELRNKLDLKINYCFTREDKNVNNKIESETYIKNIITDNNYIILKEIQSNILIHIDDLTRVYIKCLTSIKLSKLRESLKIQKKYKFLKGKNFILYIQEDLYTINDILTNESEIKLKLDDSIGNNFSEKENNSLQGDYFFELGKKIYKIKLNHDDLLYEVRKKKMLLKLENYYFLNYNGKKILPKEEKELTINLISNKKDNKMYVNIVKYNEPIQSSKFIAYKNNLKIYAYPKSNLNSFQQQKCKSLLVLGETGSGKTTLLNCLINYLMGIDKNDDFRYILFEEYITNSIKSDTSNINCYYILPSNNEYPPIKVIDTPGFGDTRENFDFEVLNKFKNFFDIENSIDLICFVMKSTVNRNTEFQKYIISNILGLFGKDLISNFILLFTFCDGGQPLFINSLKSEENPFNKIINNLSEPSYILFNNSAIFSDEENYKNLFWDICYDGFSQLMQKLKNIDANHLYLTKDVIKLRNDILIKSESLNKILDKCLEIQDNLDHDIKVSKEILFIMEKNKDYISIIKEEKKEKIKTKQGIHNINCYVCNKTCHKFCEEIINEDISNCKIMENFICKICQCSYESHCDLPFYISEKVEEKEKIDFYKRKTLDKMQVRLSEIVSIIEGKKKDLKKYFTSAEDCVGNIEKNFANLNKISLFSNIYKTQESFINYKIIMENRRKEKGYLKKIKIYEKYKSIFNRLNNIYNQKNIFKEFEQFDKDFNENKELLSEKVANILIDCYKQK